MSKIEQLIQQLCPEGVEYKRLGEVCEMLDNKRKPVTKSAREKGTYPYYGANGIQDYVSDYIFDGVFVLVGEDGSVITANGKPFVTWAEGKIWVNNHAHVISERKGVMLRFLFHYLQTVDISKLIHGTIPKFTGKDIKQLLIPLLPPPLPVQQEIVRILDAFTQLEAELEAELEARKKQYAYYRDTLLSFEHDDPKVEWKKLGEVGTFTRGNGLQKKDFTESGVGCIHYGQIYTRYSTATDKTISYCSPELAKRLKKARKGDLIIATTSENVEDVCKAVVWLGDEEIAVSGDACIFSHNQNPKYIGYWYQSQAFFDQKKRKATGTKVIRVSKEAMADFLIPLPPLPVQREIVRILDKFSAITTDLQSGLPAEIEARKKQYEYYRDKLLTFKVKN